MKNDFKKMEAQLKSKRNELFDVLQFLQSNQILEQGEEPDFVLDLLGHRIGIEHTRLFKDEAKNGSLLKAKENQQQEIIETARKFYCASSHQSLYVTVDFKDHKNFKSSDRQLLSKELCHAVQEMEKLGWISREGKYLECWRANRLLKHKIPQIISTLWIQSGLEDDELWSVSGGGAIGPIPSQLIQDCIARKEERISSYKKRCDEVWLLVVVSGFPMSSMFTDDDSFTSQQYKSSFDKIFLLQSFRNRVYHLDVSLS